MTLSSVFKKTEQALKRTKESWSGKFNQLFERATLDEGIWDELEELLILADVGVRTTEKLICRMKERGRVEGFSDASKVRQALKQEIVSILCAPKQPQLSMGRANVVVVVGVNGSGKTTSIAKLANLLKSQNYSVLLAAGDTFRAAAIDQLKLWGERIGSEVIATKPGGDPGAVVFDALQAATSRGANVVIVDTAGRLHTKFNLMEELKKIRRIAAKAAPEALQSLLVLDATTGQNGLEQARYFTEAVDLAGVFLTKLDGTAKGGIVLSICDQLGLPILYIGTGESVDDVAPFDPVTFVDALFGGEG